MLRRCAQDMGVTFLGQLGAPRSHPNDADESRRPIGGET